MPTYEYLCSAGHHFEQFQRMSEPPIDRCPTCGAPAQRQLSAGAGLLFKGSGFYITDYRSDSYRKAAEADKGGAASAEKTDAGKTAAESSRSEKSTTQAKDGGGSASAGKAE